MDLQLIIATSPKVPLEHIESLKFCAGWWLDESEAEP